MSAEQKAEYERKKAEEVRAFDKNVHEIIKDPKKFT